MIGLCDETRVSAVLSNTSAKVTIGCWGLQLVIHHQLLKRSSEAVSHFYFYLVSKVLMPSNWGVAAAI